MELWGGIECTVNRVGARTFDQLARNGHYDRPDDLDRIAGLGIRRMRYPVLWETAATAVPGEFDFRFADERLARLRELGIVPIAGLVHHGSGPPYTSLLDPEFATGLADYARQVATRYPWLEWYTPVNEPLTTARFCGLYGHWLPHARSNQAFARMFVNECRAIVLAMRAIREINPAARLVQTEDLGTIYSTSPLEYQAAFENERRWLTWDLLCGLVDVTHPMHAHLVAWGIDARELAWFIENRCPPHVMGVDHYVTSDRFLDHVLERHPQRCHGGNAFDRYADVEAVRMLERPGTSLRHILIELGQRYRRPIALTEVHLGCTEDEQVRWLHDAWTTCEQLAASGVDIRAITSWAMLGCYDWDTLLTAGGDTYESGAFCVRSGTPRETAVGEYVRTQCHGGDVRRLAALREGTDGWWRRPERLLHGVALPCRPESAILTSPVRAGQFGSPTRL